MARFAVSPRRPLNPFLLRRILASGLKQKPLAHGAGFPNYSAYFNAIRMPVIVATPLTVARLRTLAWAVGFDPDELFLDEPISDRRGVPTHPEKHA